MFSITIVNPTVGFITAVVLVLPWLLWKYTRKPEIVISDIFYNGLEYRTEGDEYVEVSNAGTSPGDISGYHIEDGGLGETFFFPEGTLLPAGASVRVYTNLYDPSTGGFSFGSKRAIWNNKGDIGRIYDASNNLVDEYAYGNKTF
jgi:hypothetical protein